MTDKAEPPMSRRECLAWLSRAAGCAVIASCSLTGSAGGDDKKKDKDKEKKLIKIAELLAVPNESAQLLEKPEVILVRTAKGIAVMSAYCSHRRNKLSVEEDGAIFCPVHSSLFDLTGQPQTGPANKALTWYQTEVAADGAISVNTSKSVKQGTWAALPDWARPAAPAEKP